MANRVILSPEYFPNPVIGRPLSNADIYVGVVDLDPKILSNQKQISVLREDGTTVEVSQPISTNGGGVPVYSGEYVTILVDGSYSLRVDDKTGAQVYYIPKNSLINSNDGFDSIADLKATTDTLEEGQIVSVLGYYTAAENRAWRFQWHTSDLSSEVTSDPMSGIYVAPDSDPTGASGAFSRLWEGAINPIWFGAVGDKTTDDTASVQAAVNIAYANPMNPIDLEISGRHLLTGEITITSSLNIATARDKSFTIFGKGEDAGFYTELIITMFGSADDYTAQAQERQVIFKNIGFETDVNTTNAFVMKGAFIQILFDECTFNKIKCNTSSNNSFSKWFRNCYMANWSGKWFELLGASANDISLTGCYVNGGDKLADLGLTQMFRFIDNTVESCTGTPITTRGARGCLIAGNYFEANALATGDCYIDLNTTGTAELSGVSITGNHIFCTDVQLADANFYAVKTIGANGFISSGNWCFGQFYKNTTPAPFGFNSYNDLEGVTGPSALPAQRIGTVDIKAIRSLHMSVGGRTFEDYEDLIVGTQQAFLNTDAENELDYEIGRIGSRIRISGTTADSSFANIRFITDAVSWFKGAMVFETNGADGTGTAPTERMRILANGNVGIGTTTPGSKLSVVGLPTSASGLSTGDIWNNSGVLNIVP